ncbi:hypothetical protein GIB67_026847 [Kingdonia uniflora]|uniref:Rho termination factor-like N-terminal domain-containing protein n=1 Tax=Kingdonia uniflora TaxID=39325 RepID=A0A7J7M7S5_9MAGN|nr:hypothetical protein GIB67_026847 [Kingdonia uniflora]
MSQAIHLIPNSIPGYDPTKGRCLLCLGVSGGSSSNSCPQGKVVLTKRSFHVSKRSSVVCSSSSADHRRNPDFFRQNKENQVFSRNKNRQNPERDNHESLEESELLSSKNGPLLSLSGSPRFQATATPGPKEKEIVELFRKVQVQLRQRAAIKEGKKTETSQGSKKETETVDSLLKLLRKHSVEQGKRNSGDTVLESSEQNNPFDEEQSTDFFDSNTIPREEPRDTNSTIYRRPTSNFVRKSPVPRVKYQPIIPVSPSKSKSLGRRKKNESEIEPESEPEPESESEPEPEPELELELESELVASDEQVGAFDEISDTDEPFVEDVVEEDVVEAPISNDLSALKLVELRALAKSRGVKGYSKVKKAELIKLLSDLS